METSTASPCDSQETVHDVFDKEEPIYAEIQKECASSPMPPDPCARVLHGVHETKTRQARAQLRIPEGEEPYSEGDAEGGRAIYQVISEGGQSRNWSVCCKDPSILLAASPCIPEEDEDAFSGEYSSADVEDDQVYVAVTNEWDGSYQSYPSSIYSQEEFMVPDPETPRLPRPPTQVVVICDHDGNRPAREHFTDSNSPPEELPNEKSALRVALLLPLSICYNSSRKSRSGSRQLVAGFALFIVLMALLMYLSSNANDTVRTWCVAVWIPRYIHHHK